MEDAIVLHQVHLLDAGDGVDAQALERALQPLVIGGSGLMLSLLLPAERSRRSTRWARRPGESAAACWLAGQQGDRCTLPRSFVIYQTFSHLLIVPLPPVRTADAIFMSLSRSMVAAVVAAAPQHHCTAQQQLDERERIATRCRLYARAPA